MIKKNNIATLLFLANLTSYKTIFLEFKTPHPQFKTSLHTYNNRISFKTKKINANLMKQKYK